MTRGGRLPVAPMERQRGWETLTPCGCSGTMDESGWCGWMRCLRDARWSVGCCERGCARLVVESVWDGSGEAVLAGVGKRCLRGVVRV